MISFSIRFTFRSYFVLPNSAPLLLISDLFFTHSFNRKEFRNRKYSSRLKTEIIFIGVTWGGGGSNGNYSTIMCCCALAFNLFFECYVVKKTDGSKFFIISFFATWDRFRFCNSPPPPPPPSSVGAYYLHPPQARVIFLHDDLPSNDTCSVIGGS